MEWISIEDRLPAGSHDYLCMTGHEQNVLYFDGADFIPCREAMIVENEFSEDGLFYHVTHWMPLPYPPD